MSTTSRSKQACRPDRTLTICFVLVDVRCFASDPQGVEHAVVVVVVLGDVVADAEVTAATGAVPSASVMKSAGSGCVLNGLILIGVPPSWNTCTTPNLCYRLSWSSPPDAEPGYATACPSSWGRWGYVSVVAATAGGRVGPGDLAWPASHRRTGRDGSRLSLADPD